MGTGVQARACESGLASALLAMKFGGAFFMEELRNKLDELEQRIGQIKERL
jgi:hypothetical protein